MKCKLGVCRGLWGFGFSRSRGTLFPGAHSKDHNESVSKMGSPYLGKLPGR